MDPRIEMTFGEHTEPAEKEKEKKEHDSWINGSCITQIL